MKLIELIELCRIHIRSILWVLCSFKTETHRGYFHFTFLMLSICLIWDSFMQLKLYKFTFPWHVFNHRYTRFPEGFLLYSFSYDHYFLQKNNRSSRTVHLNSYILVMHIWENGRHRYPINVLMSIHTFMPHVFYLYT